MHQVGAHHQPGGTEGAGVTDGQHRGEGDRRPHRPRPEPCPVRQPRPEQHQGDPGGGQHQRHTGRPKQADDEDDRVEHGPEPRPPLPDHGEGYQQHSGADGDPPGQPGQPTARRGGAGDEQVEDGQTDEAKKAQIPEGGEHPVQDADHSVIAFDDGRDRPVCPANGERQHPGLGVGVVGDHPPEQDVAALGEVRREGGPDRGVRRLGSHSLVATAAVVELESVGDEHDRLVEGEFHRARSGRQHRTLARVGGHQLGVRRGRARGERQHQCQRGEQHPEQPADRVPGPAPGPGGRWASLQT